MSGHVKFNGKACRIFWGHEGVATLEVDADTSRTYSSGSEEGRALDTELGQLADVYSLRLLRVVDVFGTIITQRYTGRQ